MARKVTKNTGNPLATFVTFLLFLTVVYAIPVIVFNLLREKYKLIRPKCKGKNLCLFSLFLVAITQFGFSTLMLVNLKKAESWNLFTSQEWELMIAGLIISIPFLITFWIGFRKYEKQLLGIDDYRQELSRVLANKISDDSEIEKLQLISKLHDIPNEILQEEHDSVYLNAIYDTADDLKVDTEEVAAMESFATRIGAIESHFNYPAEYTQKINKTKKLIRRLQLEVIDPPDEYILKPGEECYFFENCELFESVKDERFSGTSISLQKIISLDSLFNPGVYLGKRTAYGSMKQIDAGILIITNQRIAFLGQAVLKEFLYEKVLGINVGYDGIQISQTMQIGNANKEVFKLGALNKDMAVALITFITTKMSDNRKSCFDNPWPGCA